MKQNWSTYVPEGILQIAWAKGDKGIVPAGYEPGARATCCGCWVPKATCIPGYTAIPVDPIIPGYMPHSWRPPRALAARM